MGSMLPDFCMPENDCLLIFRFQGQLETCIVLPLKVPLRWRLPGLRIPYPDLSIFSLTLSFCQFPFLFVIPCLSLTIN